MLPLNSARFTLLRRLKSLNLSWEAKKAYGRVRKREELERGESAQQHAVKVSSEPLLRQLRQYSRRLVVVYVAFRACHENSLSDY